MKEVKEGNLKRGRRGPVGYIYFFVEGVTD